MLRLTPVEAAHYLGAKVKPSAKGEATSAGKKLRAEKKRAQADALARKARTMLLGLPAYSTELLFHPTRKWRFDYAWPELRVALELHGGIHSGGRHTNGKGFTTDREKMNEATLLGWHVLEITPEHIKNGTARQWLEQLIQRKQGNDGINTSDV